MDNTVDFEKALSRLEEIVSTLERGDCPLGEAMSLFEEGARLSGQCSQALESARQKITELSQEGEAPHEE